MTVARDELIDYPFPLKAATAILRLPPNLQADDAKRLVEFVNALVVDWGDEEPVRPRPRRRKPAAAEEPAS
jgi:hypothetical protein